MKASVDRIGDDNIVLVICDDNGTIVQLPAFLFPGAKEGDIVDLQVTRDEAGTAAAREKSREMVLKLSKKSIH
jgi:hypothetical protein